MSGGGGGVGCEELNSRVRDRKLKKRLDELQTKLDRTIIALESARKVIGVSLCDKEFNSRECPCEIKESCGQFKTYVKITEALRQVKGKERSKK